jgi:hypothetical protein
MKSVPGTGANSPGDPVARVLLEMDPRAASLADARAPAAAGAKATWEVGARERSRGASADSGCDSGAAGINGKHTTVAPERVMRERIGKVLLDRFSVSL